MDVESAITTLGKPAEALRKDKQVSQQSIRNG